MMERRGAFRWQLDTQGSLETETERSLCRVLDMSLRGMHLYAPKGWVQGQVVRLRLRLEDTLSVSCEALVSWQRPWADGAQYGLMFIRINDASKEAIFRFVQKVRPEEVRRRWAAG